MDRRVSRIASFARSRRCSSRPDAARVALVEDQIQHVQHRRERCARSLAVGRRNGTPDALIVCFARLIRCAIVASGTRNARAISAVVRPPTARSVSAIADEGVSAAWQHMNSRMSVSSCSTSSRRQRPWTTVGTAARRVALAPAAGALAADVIGHPPRRDLDQPAARIVGHALARPLRGRGDERLLHRVLGRGEVTVAPHRPRRAPAGRDRAAVVRSRGLDIYRDHRSSAVAVHCLHIHDSHGGTETRRSEAAQPLSSVHDFSEREGSPGSTTSNSYMYDYDI